ncbi:MAG: hypothetical protein A3F12_01245 [Gammaproteobacteria bacterium RIFCSPHIGHO2_12_FULL_38_14]|nr:MAG: hypothetical protein A3F12_01245 [Gammaproteobacteria bacterium RIFCSPHIGHO2_12_FULL_38_14]
MRSKHNDLDHSSAAPDNELNTLILSLSQPLQLNNSHSLINEGLNKNLKRKRTPEQAKKHREQMHGEPSARYRDKKKKYEAKLKQKILEGKQQIVQLQKDIAQQNKLYAKALWENISLNYGKITAIVTDIDLMLNESFTQSSPPRKI